MFYLLEDNKAIKKKCLQCVWYKEKIDPRLQFPSTGIVIKRKSEMLDIESTNAIWLC